MALGGIFRVVHRDAESSAPIEKNRRDNRPRVRQSRIFAAPPIPQYTKRK